MTAPNYEQGPNEAGNWFIDEFCDMLVPMLRLKVALTVLFKFLPTTRLLLRAPKLWASMSLL